MKWSRFESHNWEEDQYEEVEWGDDGESLINDIINREKKDGGALESLQQEVDVMKKILGRMLEEMKPRDIEKVIGDATYHGDYTVKGT